MAELGPVGKESAFMTLDEMARDICSYLKDHTATRLYVPVMRVLKHALYQENIHLSPSIKSIPVVVGDNMTALLPNDVVLVTKVGVCCSNGKLKVLGRDDTLCRPTEEDFFQCCTCDNESAETTTTGAACCPACTFHTPEFNSSFPWYGDAPAPRYMYGYSPKMFAEMGYFRHDVENGVIIFSGGCEVQPGSVVMVEYKSALSVEAYQLTPRLWYFTMQHRVAQQLTSGGEKNQEMKLFRMERDMVKRTIHPFTFEDIIAALRGGYYPAPKR